MRRRAAAGSSEREFEDAIAATNLLPGPASTQLAIYCAWRLRGVAGALVGGLGFILPGLVADPRARGAVPRRLRRRAWVLGAGAGAGAAVAAVAVHAAAGLAPAELAARAPAHAPLGRSTRSPARSPRPPSAPGWCSSCSPAARSRSPRRVRPSAGVARLHAWPLLAAAAAASGGLLALAWVAFKVGALSYGGGFVIIPLMQHDAVEHLPLDDRRPVPQRGRARPGHPRPGRAHGRRRRLRRRRASAAALLAAAVAFAPSFSFILLGADRFDRLRANARVRAFLDGAGPAAIGAIVGSAIPLARALSEPWQFAVLAAAAVALLALRRGVVITLVAAGIAGAVVSVAGGPLPS